MPVRAAMPTYILTAMYLSAQDTGEIVDENAAISCVSLRSDEQQNYNRRGDVQDPYPMFVAHGSFTNVVASPRGFMPRVNTDRFFADRCA